MSDFTFFCFFFSSCSCWNPMCVLHLGHISIQIAQFPVLRDYLCKWLPHWPMQLCKSLCGLTCDCSIVTLYPSVLVGHTLLSPSLSCSWTSGEEYGIDVNNSHSSDGVGEEALYWPIMILPFYRSHWQHKVCGRNERLGLLSASRVSIFSLSRAVLGSIDVS